MEKGLDPEGPVRGPGRWTGGRADHAAGRIRCRDPGPYRSNPSCGAGPRTAAGSDPAASAPTQEQTGGTAEGNRHVLHRKARQIFPQPPPPFISDSLNIRGGEIGVAAQLRAQVAEGSEAVAEAFHGCPCIEPLEEVGPERFVLDLGPGCRIAEGFGGILHGNTCSLVTSPNTSYVNFRRNRKRRKPRAGAADLCHASDRDVGNRDPKVQDSVSWCPDSARVGGRAFGSVSCQRQ